MTAVFADTFFWIALAELTDSAHRRALDFALDRENSVIVTTDEVLVEYLTYFATAHERMRRKAVTHAQRILDDPVSVLWFRAGNRFFRASLFMAHVPTRATA